MAREDAASNIVRTGMDPYTGSILSPQVRELIVNRTIINASTIRSDILGVEQRRNIVDTQTSNVITQQEQTLSSLNSNILSLRSEIDGISDGLDRIASLISRGSFEEQQRLRDEESRNRLLAERQVRIGKENEIETKITNAVIKPVNTLAPKMNDIFGRIGTALGLLFAGWLTDQTAEAIQASEDGNTQKLNAIKRNIVKNLGIIVGGLIAIRAGFSAVKSVISRISKNILEKLVTNPLRFVGDVFRKRNRGRSPGGRPSTTTPNTPRTPPKPRGVIRDTLGKGKDFLFQNSMRLLTTFMNLKNGENADALIGAISTLGGANVWVRLVTTSAKLAYGADQIAEIFGSNIFGKNPNNKVVADQIVEEANKLNENKNKTESPPPSNKPLESKIPESKSAENKETQSSQESKQTIDPVIKPESITSLKKDIEKNIKDTVSPQETIMGDNVTDQSMIPPMEDSTNIETSSGTEVSMIQSTASSDQSSLENSISSQSNQMESEETKQVSPVIIDEPVKEQQSKVNAESITPASIATIPPKPQKVGQLPEPKPSLTMIKTSSGQKQQEGSVVSSEAIAEVPLINSSNSDNFYLLYSQLTYNVIV
jgi:hypothetical protein